MTIKRAPIPIVVGNKNQLAALNNLLSTLNDSAEGYETAAAYVDDPELKHLFEKFADQRRALGGELANLVVDEAGQPNLDGSIEGALHRAWMKLKTAITTNDEKAVLEEVERGEDKMLQAYTRALEAGLSVDVRDVVVRQQEEVQKAHNWMKELRDSYKHA